MGHHLVQYRFARNTRHVCTFTDVRVKVSMFLVTAPIRRPHCCKFYHVILSWS